VLKDDGRNMLSVIFDVIGTPSTDDLAFLHNHETVAQVSDQNLIVSSGGGGVGIDVINLMLVL
jgi:hypothetical protein